MLQIIVRATLLAGLCATGATGAAAAPIRVHTVNYPLHYFAERIAGEHADVVFPAPGEIDPAFWQPPIEVISDYQQADLILLNGADYAQWMDKVSLARSRLVNTSKLFADRYITIEGAASHSHGGDGKHSHAGTAWTTWLDFQQAASQARAVGEALSRKRPQLRDTFERRLETLVEELMSLDQQMMDLTGKQVAMPLLASHPVYHYLARRYELNLRSVQWEPQQVPVDAQWAELTATLKQHPARWILWEAQPAADSVARLAAMGVASVVFDPCANVPRQSDWLAVMRQNIENMKPVFLH